MLLTLLLLAAPPPSPEFAARAAELQARARAHHEAREYMQAANAYVALSAIPGVDVDDALGRAHLDLEALPHPGPAACLTRARRAAQSCLLYGIWVSSSGSSTRPRRTSPAWVRDSSRSSRSAASRICRLSAGSETATNVHGCWCAPLGRAR